MPDRYEAGSHNAIGIAGLAEGVRWLLEQTVESLHERETALVRTFIAGLEEITGLTYYGPRTERDRIGVFSIRVEGFEPMELSSQLETQFGVLTRPGLHCAPHIHETIGTAATGGTTRLSLGPFLTDDDVAHAIAACASLAAGVTA
jgi:selenocysteine lyase/cysteine desulfurase